MIMSCVTSTFDVYLSKIKNDTIRKTQQINMLELYSLTSTTCI